MADIRLNLLLGAITAFKLILGLLACVIATRFFQGSLAIASRLSI